MGPLQRSVYWKLCLLFFLTAFMFFADVFTVNLISCAETGSFLNFTEKLTESVFSRENDTWNNVTESVNSSECVEMELFAFGQTMYMIGLLFGSPVGGALADRYGKQRLLVASAALQAVTALCSAFSPSAVFHLAVRCVAGMACCGINISSFSLGVEWSLPRYRTWPPALLSFFFSLGMMSLAGTAYLCSGVVQLYLSMAIPQILCLPLYLSIPESPRWLLLNGKMEIVRQYRARSHKDQENLDQLLDLMGKEDQKPTGKYSSPKRHSDLVYFKSPTIILRLFVMSYIGLASGLTYYGICFNVGNFGVQIYLAQFFSGLSETPSLLMPLLLGCCGRRPFTMISLFLSGSACLLSVLISKFYDAPALVMSLALMGKLCIQATTCVTLLYGIELFPTVIRQRCVGMAYLWYRIGCILNAVASLQGGVPLVAMLCYGSGPIVGAGLCLLLPETSSRPLPDTVPDCEAQKGALMPLCCPLKEVPGRLPSLPRERQGSGPASHPREQQAGGPASPPREQQGSGPASHPREQQAGGPASPPRERQGSGPASHPREQQAGGPASPPRERQGSGPASHPREQQAGGPASPPREQQGSGPASHPREQQAGGPASPPREQQGSGPASHPREQQAGGPASPPREQQGSGPASPPREQQGSGPASPPRERQGSGPASHPRERQGSGPASSPREQQGSGPASHPREQQAGGPASPPREQQGSGPASPPREQQGSGPASLPRE